MRAKITLVFAAMLLVVSITAYAHHSQQATYDLNKKIELKGKLVQFMFRNPHAFVTLEAPDETGVMQKWSVEWAGAAQLGGQGVTRDTFKIGDEVTITGNPSRTLVDHRLHMVTIKRERDGFGWGTRAGEVVD
jgi:Family of unknown function (DUF6152)